MDNIKSEQSNVKPRKRLQIPKMQVTECVREFKLRQAFPSLANAVKTPTMNMTVERVRVPPSTINVKIKSGKIDPNHKLQKLKLKGPDGRDLGEFDVQVLPQITSENSLTALKTISPDTSTIPQLQVPGLKPISTMSSIKYGQKLMQEARTLDQGTTHGVLIPISPVVLNGKNYTVQTGACQQIKVENLGTVDSLNPVPLNFNGIQPGGNVNVKNTTTLPPGMKIKLVNSRNVQRLNGAQVMDKKKVIGNKRKSLGPPASRIDSNKIVRLNRLEGVNLEKGGYYMVPDEVSLGTPGVVQSMQNSMEDSSVNARQISRNSLGRINLLRREKKDSKDSKPLKALSGSTRSECDSTNISGFFQQSERSDFHNDARGGESAEVDENDLSVLGEALRSLPDEELRNKALEALRSVGIGVERLIPKKAIEQTSVTDSDTQTEIFGLLDKEKDEFIRATEDAEGLERIPLKERQFETTEKEKECRQPVFDGLELDAMLGKITDNERSEEMKKVNSIMKYDPGTEKLFSQLQRDFSNIKKYDENGWLQIHNAVVDDNVVAVKKQLILFKACKVHVDIPTQEGQSSLELAIKYRSSQEIIRLLLRTGANPTSSKLAHDSALTMASREGMSCLPLLIKHSPTPGALNYLDSNGFAAIHHCSQLGNYDGVIALIAADADLNVRDSKSGRTALFHALENDELKIARELLFNGAKPNLPIFSGQTCYHLIDENKHASLKDLLPKATK